MTHDSGDQQKPDSSDQILQPEMQLSFQTKILDVRFLNGLVRAPQRLQELGQIVTLLQNRLHRRSRQDKLFHEAQEMV